MSPQRGIALYRAFFGKTSLLYKFCSLSKHPSLTIHAVSWLFTTPAQPAHGRRGLHPAYRAIWDKSALLVPAMTTEAAPLCPHLRDHRELFYSFITRPLQHVSPSAFRSISTSPSRHQPLLKPHPEARTLSHLGLALVHFSDPPAAQSSRDK